MIKKILLTLCLLITLATSASAQFTFPINHFSSSGGGQDLLEDVLSQTEFDIVPVDSQTQLNLTETPSSGESQSAYNAYLGADGDVTSSDPAYTAGSPNYLAHDGTDYLTQIAAYTTFQKALHKTTSGQAATIGIAFRTPSSFSATSRLWGTSGPGGRGIGLIIESSGGLKLQIAADSGTDNWALGSALSTSTNYYVLVGFDFTSSTTNVEYWTNTTTGTTDTDGTNGGSTTDPITEFSYGSRVRGITSQDQILENGFRTYAYNGFTGVLSDANAATAFGNICTRLNINFTGSCL